MNHEDEIHKEAKSEAVAHNENSETDQSNLVNNVKNNSLKKSKRIERSEWKFDKALPKGWKRRSYENTWNKNGEKIKFIKYEYLSPSEKMFNTKKLVIAHMLEFPLLYSEEQILNFRKKSSTKEKYVEAKTTKNQEIKDDTNDKVEQEG